jgi:hypothetical protein
MRRTNPLSCGLAVVLAVGCSADDSGLQGAEWAEQSITVGGTDHSQPFSQDIRIDNVYVEGTGTHGVETYGVNNLTIGTVVARNTRDAGLLLNLTTNAQIGTVDASNVATGTGYAALRMANRNGRINNTYPTNIRVGQVIARGGGRGIFCVSESGGAGHRSRRHRGHAEQFDPDRELLQREHRCSTGSRNK